MTIEVYKGMLFQTGHERRALGRFLQDLKSRFDDTNELYMVVIEVDVNGAAIDLFLLCPHAMIIADLKELTGINETEKQLVHLTGTTNGQWHYTIPGTLEDGFVGGSANKKNPYKQLSQMRYKFASWLELNSGALFDQAWKKETTLSRLDSWVIISPGFDGKQDGIQLPTDEAHSPQDWFRLISIDALAWELHCTTNLEFELTERQMHALVEKLGASKIQHLGEVLPENFPTDLPPVSQSFLFSHLPECRNLIGRREEISHIIGWLEDPAVSFILVRGMGGIGKTSLLGSIITPVEAQGWKIKYIACKEKELTSETFIAAVASEMVDRTIAHLILDKGIPLLDRIDVALNYLEANKTLLVIDDFQNISNQESFTVVLLKIVYRSENIKAIISSRERPEFADHPRLPSGAVSELFLNGLEKEDILTLIIDQISPQYLEWIYTRTGGNPYAINLLKPLIRKYGWNETVLNLPLYKTDKDNWFDSLVCTLDKDSEQLASRLSIIRSRFDDRLIAHLWHNPTEALFLASDLVEKNIIQKSEFDGQFVMHDFIREYLYDQFTDQTRRSKAHLDAGNYYRKGANAALSEYQAADALYEAIYHYELANHLDEILDLSQNLFLILYNHGDWDRAQVIAEKALKVARSKNQPLEIARWLVHNAGWKIDHDLFREAGTQLQQADDLLTHINRKVIEKDNFSFLTIKSKIFVEKGRVAYYISEFDRATDHLNDAMSIIKEIRDEDLLANCLLRIARIERQKGDFVNSKLHFNQARQIAEECRNTQILMQALSHLALIARQQNDFSTARRLFEEAYEKAKEIDDWRGMEINRSLLADLYRREGNFPQATEIFRICLSEARKVGNGVAIRINLGQLAESLIRMNKVKEAEPYLVEAEERCFKAEDGVGIAWTLYRKGLSRKTQGDISTGDALIHQAIEKLHEIGSEVYVQDFEKDLGPIQPALPGFFST